MDLSHKKSILLLTISSIMIFIIVYYIAAEIFEPKSYNFMVKIASRNKIASKDVVMVVIDDKSLSELGRWPWKRTRFIQIFDYLKNYTSAKVYGFDALIAAPDKEDFESDKKFFTGVKNYDQLVAGMAFDYGYFKNEAYAQRYTDLLKEKSNITIIDKRSQKNKEPSPFKSFTESPFEYMQNVNALGSVDASDVNPRSDGYIRRVGQIVNFNGNLFPSLGLLMYSKHTGIKDFVLTDKFLTGQNENFRLKMPAYTENGVVYSYLCFYNSRDGVYSHQRVSASDVIKSLELIHQGKKPILDPEIFNDKIVFVGAYANAQALQDIKRTPISDSLAGLEIQATSFNNFLNNEFYVYAKGIFRFILVLALTLVVFLVICSMPVPAAILSTSSIMLIFFIFSYIMCNNKVVIGLILPEAFMVMAIGIGYSYRYILEGRKKEKIQSAMGKYISKDVMKNVIDNIDSVRLGGKRANVTVLFTDIRGFTTISERLSAEEVTAILNEYFSALVPIIDKHNGILNKFMGDALLAVFGEPIQDENHPVNAVKCADEMLRKVKNLQEKWISEGKPKIDVGIGIATGDAFVGNIGSEERLEYTVIGDTVNTASRIENYNKVYKTKFLISEETFERVQKYVDVIKIRDVVVRGKVKKINIYEVLRLIKQ